MVNVTIYGSTMDPMGKSVSPSREDLVAGQNIVHRSSTTTQNDDALDLNCCLSIPCCSIEQESSSKSTM